MNKVVGYIVPGFVLLLAFLWFGGRFYLEGSVANYDGEVNLIGLENQVQVTFDDRGIPQVWAQTDADMYRSLGFVHASERLFQMELVRRMSGGMLSELFGEAAYEIDKFQRTIGYRRQAEANAENISPETRKYLEAYVAGVNNWIQNASVLPPEFVILQFEPKLWTIEDCIQIAIYQTWFSHELADREDVYSELIKQFGSELETSIEASKTWSPTTLDKSVLSVLFSQDAFPGRIAEASNSWVVSPAKSTTGQAIHASDPHLQTNAVPGLWYIAGLHSAEGTDVVGVTAVGLPFVAMGHNRDIAWAFTVSAVDIIDYYDFQRSESDSMAIDYFSELESLTSVEEVIVVKDEVAPRIVKVLISSAGPIVESTKNTVTAIRWAGHDFSGGKMIQSGFNLHSATNFDEFRRRVTSFGALDANWTFSDRKGNIGYQLGTPIPIRNHTHTFRRLDGSNAELKWQGYHSLDETPAVLNPEKGWLASCNNRIVPADWPYEIPGYYDPYRIPRATALLTSKTKFTPKELGEFQLDDVSGYAVRWKDLVAAGADALGEPELATRLRDWDGSMSVDNDLPAIFSYWWQNVNQQMWQDQLDSNYTDGIVLLEEVMTAEITTIIDDISTPESETLTQLSALALAEVLPSLNGKTWGDVSTHTIIHPLSQVEILDTWLSLNRGPYQMPGDPGSLNANFMSYNDETNAFENVAGPSMRYVLDWANVDGFTMNIAFGQSGNPFSPHYDDFLYYMQSGNRWNVPFSRGVVAGRAKSILKLIP